MLNFDQILSDGIDKLGLTVSASGRVQLLEYAELLHKWNKTYNLTAAKTLQEIIINHVLDSLSISPYISGPQILDIGSGAGLPGIPLAIINPKFHFTLLDSIGKKIHFLRHVKLVLKLTNIEVMEERIEKFKPSICFNTIVARALASLSDIILMTKHLYCSGAQLLAMKGKYPHDEIDAAVKLPLNLNVIVKKLEVPFLDHERHLVCVSVEGVDRA
jgi:16S rRNA (guanine527-N7)-methyltransferase